jgi:hypothetical protein
MSFISAGRVAEFAVAGQLGLELGPVFLDDLVE